MPSLTATLGLDSVQFKTGLDNAVTKSKSAGAQIMSSLNIGKSTVFNPMGAKSKEADYTAWWGNELSKRSKMETTASVEAATRSNRARALLRERSAAHSAKMAAAEQATVMGQARTAVGGALAAYGPAALIVGGAYAAKAAAIETIHYGDALEELGLRIGVSASDLSAWDYALKQSGSSVFEQVKFFEFLAKAKSKAMAGDRDMLGFLAKFGIESKSLQAMNTQQIAFQVARKYEDPGVNPQDLTLELEKIGGKGAGGMVAAFRSGFSQMIADAPRISDEAAAAFGRAADKWTAIGIQIRNSLITPILEGFLKVQEFSETGIVFLKDLAQGYQQTRTAAGALLNANAKARDRFEKTQDHPDAWMDKINWDKASPEFAKRYAAKSRKAAARADESESGRVTFTNEEGAPEGVNETKGQTAARIKREKRNRELNAERKDEEKRKADTEKADENLAEKRFGNSLKSMTVAEQRVAIQGKIKDLEDKANEAEWGLGDDVKAASLRTEQEGWKGKLLDMDQQEKKADDKANSKLFQPDLNSLQRIGAYSQASEVVIAQRQREQSNTLLKSMDTKLAALIQVTGGQSGTAF